MSSAPPRLAEVPAPPPDDGDWTTRAEGGNRTTIALYVAIARHLGRGVARLLCYPSTLYFYLRRGPERRASRAYLRRVLGREPRFWQPFRHMLHCSSAYIDRVFLLSEQFRRFEIRNSGLDQLVHALSLGRGTLLIGSHLGSFEALRALSLARPEVPLRVLLDKGHNAHATEILHALNPGLAAGVIDARSDGPGIVLAIRDALAEGALVTLLADRVRPGEATVTVDFLGAPARFPAAPWLLAAALGVPVVLCFGLYQGGNRYDLHFELLAERIEIPRSARQERLREWVGKFVARLEHYTRLSPYNWFNLYDFWQGGRERAAADRPGEPGA